MSRIKLDHQSAVGQTGWAMFDWAYSEGGPQLTFVSGCCDGARVQMDRYRRNLLAWNRVFQWQIFAWSTRDFELTAFDGASNVTSKFRANIRPQSTQAVDTQINDVRELRGIIAESCVNPFFATVDESWPNNFTNAPIQYQNSNAFAASFSMRGSADPPALRRSYLTANQFVGSGYAPIRIAVIGFHNARWEMGSGFPTN